MKKYLLFLLLFPVFLFGNSIKPLNCTFELKNEVHKDTIIIYSIEGISSEGTEARVKYIEGKIQSAEIYIYGDIGQIKIEYIFYKEKIKVNETVYSYKKIISNIRSNNDLFEEYELKYSIDYKGKRIKINKTIPYTDIYTEFARNIPFKINVE